MTIPKYQKKIKIGVKREMAKVIPDWNWWRRFNEFLASIVKKVKK